MGLFTNPADDLPPYDTGIRQEPYRPFFNLSADPNGEVGPVTPNHYPYQEAGTVADMISQAASGETPMIPTSYQPLDARPGETSAIDDQLTTDQPVDYTEMIREEAFIGDTPFEVIMEEITKQFEDYIDLKDKTNYVDVFYTQLHNSYAAVEEDDGEEHPVEIKEVLDKLQDEFESKMAELFTQRLTLTLAALEDEVIDREENEYIIRRLYEFFILGAKQNFLSVIAQDINARIDKIEDDRVYFNTVREMLTGFSPLVTVIGPMEFVKYRGDQEIYDLFNNGKVTGNFLRKYSPKLYNHEAFEVELINHITTLGQFTSGLAGEETT